MSDLIIRKATLSDVDAVAALCPQLSREVPAEKVEKHIRQTIDAPSFNALFIAEDDGKVAGFVSVNIYFEILTGLQARIDGIVVDENCRGKGAGKKLMEAAEQWAKENGSKSMKLNSNVKRTEAHQFYQNIGYQKTKEQAAFKKDLP